MLRTILESLISPDHTQIVIREEEGIPLSEPRRFMTHLRNVEHGYFTGHYCLTLPQAHEDFLQRCKQEGILT